MKGHSAKLRLLTSETSSSGWINLLVALVVVSVAGLLVTGTGGLAPPPLERLEEEADEEEVGGWVYAGNVAFGGSVEGALWEGADTDALCWA